MDKRIPFILNHYGYCHQLGKAKEELREAIEAIEHVEEALRTGDPFVLESAQDDLAEESADAGIMLDQLAIASQTEKLRDDYREMKLERQMIRIMKGE